jgi:HEXXH motif-containing protein
MDLVRRWPAAFRQFQLLMHTFYPIRFDDSGIVTDKFRGSASHSFAAAPGTMCATVNDPVGLAQAFVHEMAHTKLRALGIQVETGTEFIVNDPNELYESPIRKDEPRPMTAVFHAEYSFIYVTELDLRMLDDSADAAESNHIMMLLARNVPRVEEGLRTLTARVRLDWKGERLMEGFLNWAEDAIRRGRRTLGKAA